MMRRIAWLSLGLACVLFIVVTTTVGSALLAQVVNTPGTLATSFAAVTDQGLTSGRVTMATTGGLLTDNANLTFTGSNTLNASHANAVAQALLNGVVMASATAPSVTSGGCTSPAVTTPNGTAAFTITIGTSCTGVKSITLLLPAAAHQWSCFFNDQTTPASFVLSSNGTTTTAVVVSNYARTTGLAIDFVAAEVLVGGCVGS